MNEGIRHIRRGELVALALMTALALWIRLRYLGMPLRYDEAFTVWRYASRSLATVLSDYSLPNNHIFHTLVVHTLIRAGGLEPWVVRLPALLAGLALVPTTFLLFARLASISTGLVAAAFVAGSSVLIDYSVNARGYSIAALIALINVMLVAIIRSRQHSSPGLLVAICVLSSLGFWTVPLYLYPFVATLVWILLATETALARRLANASIIGAGTTIGTALLYAPVLTSTGISAVVHNKFVRPDPWSTFVTRLPTFLADVASMWTVNLPLIVVGATIVGVLVALIQRKQMPIRSLGWSLIAALLAVTGLQHAIPYTRNWLVVLPLAVGLASAGIVRVVAYLAPAQKDMRSFFSVVAVVMTVTLLLAVEDRKGTLSGESDGMVDAEAAVLDLADRITPTSRVAAAIPSTAPLLYYFALYELPMDPLVDPVSSPDSLFVVTALDQSVTDVLDSNGISAADDTRLISAYPSGELWELVPTE